jgi:hypothetical protein
MDITFFCTWFYHRLTAITVMRASERAGGIILFFVFYTRLPRGGDVRVPRF